MRSDGTTRRIALGSVAMCFAVAMAPSSWLSFVTDVEWELGVISMTGLAGAALAAGLPWARNAGSSISRRATSWALGALLAATIYVISLGPLFIVAAFSFAFCGMLDVWMARAHVASTTLRSRLEEGR